MTFAQTRCYSNDARVDGVTVVDPAGARHLGLIRGVDRARILHPAPDA